MKVYAINGSPRRNFNTAKLLHAFLEGAVSSGADVETECINLYDLDYKGCTECFSCKRKNGASYGQCGYPDGIHEILQRVSNADVIVFGSPIFFFDVTGELRCFLERLFYPYRAYMKDSARVIAPKPIRTAFIYTMNSSEEEMKRNHYEQYLASTQLWTQSIFGYAPEVMYSYDTYQYDDYDKYAADIWDIEKKEKNRQQQFPQDCKTAFSLGERLVHDVLAMYEKK